MGDSLDWVEVFRAALMREHADDWDMETVAEAAHICARQVSATVIEPARNSSARDVREALKEMLHRTLGVPNACGTACTHVISGAWTVHGVANVIGRADERERATNADRHHGRLTYPNEAMQHAADLYADAELKAIARGLAAAAGFDECVFCPAETGELGDHDAVCPYARAVAWVQAQEHSE